jgi:sulfate permease, SulP family
MKEPALRSGRVNDMISISASAFRYIRVVLNAPLAHSLVAGGIVGILSLLFYLSYAALIFSGPLAPFLAYGLTASFITGAIGGTLTSLRSSFRFAIGGPDGATCAVTAVLVGDLATRLVATGARDDLLTATLGVLALSAILTGVVLCTLGFGRLGRAIRFIPYPVIGGFLGASGCLMLMGAVKVTTGANLSIATVTSLLDAETVAKLTAGFGVFAFLLWGRRWRSQLAMPLQLLFSIAVFYAALPLLGVSVAEVQARGWTFEVPTGLAFAQPWTLEYALFPWSELPKLGADLAAVMFVGVISVLLNITSIELSTKREAKLDQELQVQGAANLLSSVLGGYISCLTSTRSKLVHALSGDHRIAGLLVAAMSGASLFFTLEYLSYMPKCVLGGLLLAIGYDSANRWLVGSARQLAIVEYLSLLAITLIIVVWGFLPGVSIGIIFGCATFALSAGSINVIKFSFDATEYRSSLDRGPAELSLLALHGHELQGLRLQSYLFFGSANRLYEYVKALLAARPECRFLLFDFKLVTGSDSSAVHSFTQIKHVTEALGVQLVLVNLTPAHQKSFVDNGFISKNVHVAEDLDHALEYCENAIILSHGNNDRTARSFREWLADTLGDGRLAVLLEQECRQQKYRAGDIIAEQGAPSDSMHFIIEGRVGVIVNLGEGRVIRVRSLGQHTTIGEMGLLTGRARSATLQAEVDSIAYELRADAFDRLKVDHPELVQVLLTFVIGLMGERLAFANKLIGVLQR